MFADVNVSWAVSLGLTLEIPKKGGTFRTDTDRSLGGRYRWLITINLAKANTRPVAQARILKGFHDIRTHWQEAERSNSY